MWIRQTAAIVLTVFLCSCATSPQTGMRNGSNPCAPPEPSLASSIMQNPFTQTLVNFGGNLLATAATNYSSQYQGKLQRLLTKLVVPKKYRRSRSQPTEPFYPDDAGVVDGDYPQDSYPYDDGQDVSSQEEYGYEDETYADTQAGNGGYDDEYDDYQGEDIQYEDDPNVEYYEEPVSRGVPGRFAVESSDDPCADQVNSNDPQYTDSEGGYNDIYAEDSGAYQESYGESSGDSYGESYGESYEGGEDAQAIQDGEPVSLDVALVKKTIRNGAAVILPINDGDVLVDGRGNAHAGDKFRIMFRTAQEAYVYVIAVDGSGWAQGIFPSTTAPFANPIAPNQQHVLPEGNNWFSLDQFRGVETLFFVASLEPRKDLEDILSGITGRERPASATPKQVTQAAMVPHGYGNAAPSPTPFGLASATGGAQEILPTSFVAKTAGEDLRVTRWFRHQ